MLRYIDFMGLDRSRMQEVYADNPFAFRQAARLARISRLFIAFILFTSAVYLLSGDLILDLKARLFAFPLMLLTIGMLVWTCHLFESGHERGGRLLFVGIFAVGAILTVIFCGGFMEGRFTAILLAPMVMALAFLGFRVATLLFVLIFAIPLAVELAGQRLGIVFPDFTSGAEKWVHQLNIMVIVSISSFLSLMHMRDMRKVDRSLQRLRSKL